ncbi:DMT family transporter [Gordonia sp. (in: high G+C Gram-positive bacteria)]|uniref:EamA family transporter n=1 Tax=Gordonia sp. (in: high G+C Gram-positive bacteria) TaxID=84139 RepID=UPI003527A302
MSQSTEVAAADSTSSGPAPADASGRAVGIAMMLTSAASNQSGAAVGALAFPAIGPVGVVAVRQMLTALVLVLLVRPRFRTLTRAQWRPVLGLGLVFAVMNLSLYASIDRIGLGLAVTLEFLGPLTVAVAGSRRALDLGCAGLAAVGVLVLTSPGPTTDVLGIALALVAAAAWGSYILLNRSLGRQLPGLHGTALASAVTAGLWLPVAVVWFVHRPPTLHAVLLAAACGVLASIIPYAVDALALRRVPTSMFGTFTSINPVFAALAGWLVLGQALALHEWVGIVLIVVSNAAVSATSGVTRRVPGSAGRAPRPRSSSAARRG